MTAVEATMRFAHGPNAEVQHWFRQITQLTIRPNMQKAMSMIT
jgi:hypothetical protein